MYVLPPLVLSDPITLQCLRRRVFATSTVYITLHFRQELRLIRYMSNILVVIVHTFLYISEALNKKIVERKSKNEKPQRQHAVYLFIILIRGVIIRYEKKYKTIKILNLYKVSIRYIIICYYNINILMFTVLAENKVYYSVS